MRIYLGYDHNGLDMKKRVKAFLLLSGYEVVDEGEQTLDPNDDFPVFAARVITAMNAGDEKDPKGILICGSGQGMCIAANRYKGIRAALCWNVSEAHAARNDDNSNVLCLSAISTPSDQLDAIVNTWLSTPFAAAPRFMRRLKEIDELA